MSILAHAEHTNTSKYDWQKVRRETPCPICKKIDWCQVSRCGTRAKCMRVEDGAYRSYSTGAGAANYHKLDEHAFATFVHPSHHAKPKSKKKSNKNWAKLAADYQRDAPLEKLANELGVSIESLQAIDTGWNGEAWTNPERDGSETITGIKRRFTNRKDYEPGGISGQTAGLTIPSGWRDANVLLLVEGASDVAASLDLGVMAIGRPSNTGGKQLLAELLKGSDAHLIVIGERDLKPDEKKCSDKCGKCGKCWPGLFGAINTAQYLADALARDIHWGLPPGEAKDVREFLNNGGTDLIDQLEAEVIQPDYEPYVEPSGELVSLDEYRDQLNQAIMDNDCGIVRAMTGVGKSYATQQRMMAEPEATMVTNAHVNCREEENSLVEINAVAFPQLTPDVCEAYDTAQTVLSRGLDVGAVMCFGNCPYADKCEYRAKLEQANKAQHRILTHERMRKSPGAAIGWTAIHEEFKPQQKSFRIEDVVAVHSIFSGIEIRLSKQNEVDAALLDFVHSVLSMCELLIDCESASTKTKITTVVSGIDKPKRWQQLVNKFCRGINVKGECLRSIVELVFGTPKQWSIVHHTTIVGVAWKEIVVDWPMPEIANPMLFDATADAEMVSAWWGRDIPDITPPGRLEYAQTVVQIPSDVTRCGSRRDKKGWTGTSPKTAAGWIRSVILDSKYQRVGVITHSDTNEHLNKYLEPQLLQRIARRSYFGAGDERASNAWSDECDAVLIVGTYRPSADTVRRELVRRGLEDAANRNPEWVDRKWEGRDEGGARVIVGTKRYDDDDWHRVHSYLVQSEMRQCIGRARAILPDGIPLVVVSPEPLDLVLALDRKKKPFSDSEMEIARAAYRLRANCTQIPNTSNRDLGTLRTKDLMDETGVIRSKISGLLGESPYFAATDTQGRWMITNTPEPQPEEPIPATTESDSEQVRESVNRELLDDATVPTDEPLHNPYEQVTERIAIKVEAGIPVEHAEHEALLLHPDADPELFEWFVERAAILEFDGGMPRAEAERAAAIAVVAMAHPT